MHRLIVRLRETAELNRREPSMQLGPFGRQQHLSAQHYLNKSPQETAIATTVALLAKYFRVPMVQVNVLDADQQVTVAAVGSPLGSTDRADSLCTHVVTDGRLKVLADIDPVPAGAAEINAYVGVPLVGREGLVIGTLCILDLIPRQFTPEDLQDLEAAAEVVQDELELMRRLEATSNATTIEANRLTVAVHEGQIVPFYQPIVDLRTGAIHALEALARWHHPTRGLLEPAAFVPLAEDSEIVIDLDLAILRDATAQLVRWRAEHPSLQLHVNLSARHFDHADCLDRLRNTVHNAGADPASITFELTETAALAAYPNDRDFLLELRRAGFSVVLDDFGSGFASVEQVLRLPIDGIKLNRTLTAAMNTRLGAAVTRHLIALARELDLSTVLEGIETDEQAEQARSIGAGHGQGYLWSRARSAHDMTQYLADSQLTGRPRHGDAPARRPPPGP